MVIAHDAADRVSAFTGMTKPGTVNETSLNWASRISIETRAPALARPTHLASAPALKRIALQLSASVLPIESGFLLLIDQANGLVSIALALRNFDRWRPFAALTWVNTDLRPFRAFPPEAVQGLPSDTTRLRPYR